MQQQARVHHSFSCCPASCQLDTGSRQYQRSLARGTAAEVKGWTLCVKCYATCLAAQACNVSSPPERKPAGHHDLKRRLVICSLRQARPFPVQTLTLTWLKASWYMPSKSMIPLYERCATAPECKPAHQLVTQAQCPTQRGPALQLGQCYAFEASTYSNSLHLNGLKHQASAQQQLLIVQVLPPTGQDQLHCHVPWHTTHQPYHIEHAASGKSAPTNSSARDCNAGRELRRSIRPVLIVRSWP